MTDKDGNILRTFDSMMEAVRFLSENGHKTNASNISGVLNKKVSAVVNGKKYYRKQVCGYGWVYI